MGCGSSITYSWKHRRFSQAELITSSEAPSPSMACAPGGPQCHSCLTEHLATRTDLSLFYPSDTSLVLIHNKYTVMGRDMTWGGEYTTQYIDDVL